LFVQNAVFFVVDGNAAETMIAVEEEFAVLAVAAAR